MPLFNNFPYTNFHQMNLDFILKKVKIIDDLDATVQELTGKYNQVFNKVNELDQLYTSFASDMQRQFNELTASVNQTVSTATTNMFNFLTNELQRFERNINALGVRVSNVEQSLTTSIYMESPFTGETVPVQQVIYDLASLHTTDALTAAEYDAAELTAAAYDALQLTAYQYDWNGHSYIN